MTINQLQVIIKILNTTNKWSMYVRIGIFYHNKLRQHGFVKLYSPGEHKIRCPAVAFDLPMKSVTNISDLQYVMVNRCY